MPDNTKRDVVAGGAGLLGTLARELLSHRTQMQQLEEKKKMELELARARQESGGDADDPPRSEPEPSRTRQSPDLSAAIRDLRRRDDCATCQTLLEAIEQADPETQAIALTEYGRFKQAMEAGASEEELRRILRSSETLEDLLEQGTRA